MVSFKCQFNSFDQRCLQNIDRFFLFYCAASDMLPEAVLPPSKEHSYAQWLERSYQARESRSSQMGNIDCSLSLFPINQQHNAISQGMHTLSQVWHCSTGVSRTYEEGLPSLCALPFLYLFLSQKAWMLWKPSRPKIWGSVLYANTVVILLPVWVLDLSF